MSLCTTLSFVSAKKYFLQFSFHLFVHFVVDEVCFFIENLYEFFVTDFLLIGVSDEFLVEDESSFFVEFFEIIEVIIVILHIGKLLDAEFHSFEQFNATASEQLLYFALVSEDHSNVLVFLHLSNQPSS
jgi:hypothetical protein